MSLPSLSPLPLQTILLDTSPFLLLSTTDIRTLATKLATTKGVLSELQTQQAQKIKLELPRIQIIDPETQDIAKVVQKAKEVGDYSVLSANDIKVAAAAVKIERLENERIAAETQEKKVRERIEKENESKEKQELEDANNAAQESDDQTMENLGKAVEGVNIHHDSVIDSSEEPKASNTAGQDLNTAEEEELESGWITPSNISKHKQRTIGLTTEDPHKVAQVAVAVMTNDFALQNVCLALSIRIMSTDGRVVKARKNQVLRCHACFCITKDMAKQFCPRCGGATLIKTNTTVNSDGYIDIHLKKNFKYHLRGTQYSLPKPKGGRDSSPFILRGDTKEYEAAARYASKIRKDALAAEDPDQGIFSSNYVSGGREKANVNVKTGRVILGTGKKNPNAVGHKKK